jgi:hypothetical protein
MLIPGNNCGSVHNKCNGYKRTIAGRDQKIGSGGPEDRLSQLKDGALKFPLLLYKGGIGKPIKRL